jgi:prolipoprotein diacylglyceryltransferase
MVESVAVNDDLELTLKPFYQRASEAEVTLYYYYYYYTYSLFRFFIGLLFYDSLQLYTYPNNTTIILITTLLLHNELLLLIITCLLWVQLFPLFHKQHYQ